MSGKDRCLQNSVVFWEPKIYYLLEASAEYNQYGSLMEENRRSSKVFKSMMEPGLHFQLKQEGSLHYMSLKVPNHRILEQMELFRWRIQHSDRVIACQWVKIEPHSDVEVAFTLKLTQKLTTLDTLKHVKGNKIMKHFSKIFESFALLYEKFGPFQLSAKMIAFDSFFEPFVWMNSDHSRNEYKRDLVTQNEFASNILFILLKNDHKFQNVQILDYCCELRGQGYNLKEMAKFFRDFQEKEDFMKKSKIQSIFTPQTSTLSFSKQSKTRKTSHKANRQLNGLSKINSEVYRSYLKSSSKQTTQTKKRSLTRTTSSPLTSSESKFQTLKVLPTMPTTTEFDDGCAIKINVLKEMQDSFYFGEEPKPVQKVQKPFEMKQRQLQISIDLGNDESQEDAVKEIIELEQLDKFKRYLVKSIINNK